MKKYYKIIVVLLLFVSLFVITGCNKKSIKYDYLVLVNKYSKLPDDWEKNVKLVDTKNAWDEDIKVEEKAYEQYKKLAKELKDEGITIKLDSSYRSVSEQQALWDDWSADPEKGIDYVKKFVAVPGFSEHHTGLAIDICLKKDGKLIYDNDEMIAEKAIFKKIHSKLAKYGFILRYLKGREDSTGYTYEPWHLRYINDPKLAKEIMDKNMTYEEYLDSVKDLNSNKEAAKYKIETTLQKYLKKAYDNKIDNVRFNVKKIYTAKEANKEEVLKDLKLTNNDLAFEVEYEVLPKEGVDTKEFTAPDGEYNEELGWVTGINRLGVLKYNSKNKTYSIENFGTGW